MPLYGYFLDSNLLVLLIVGSVGRDLISKHRRLQGYTAEDYDALLDLLERVERVFVTPNILTETSNLLGQHGEPERSYFLEALRSVIQDTEEVLVSSELAASNTEFIRLGLTDAVLLESVTEDIPLITVDSELYFAVMEKSRNAPTAVNFLRFRDS